MKKIIALLTCTFAFHSAHAFFFIIPIPNLAKPPELQKLIDALEKSSETKAVAYVSEDKTFGAKNWAWGHNAGIMSQEDANSRAMRACEASLAKAKAVTAGSQPLYDYGQKKCELYKFSNETVSLPPQIPTTTTTPNTPTPEPAKIENSRTAIKLRELESLFNQKLITQEEYDQKRKEILYSL